MIRIRIWPISEKECPDPDTYRISQPNPTVGKNFVKHKLNTEYILGLGEKFLLSVFGFRIRILSFWAIRIR
jgi:hypothetical protein